MLQCNKSKTEPHTHTHRCSVIENNAFCSDVGSVLSANYVIKKLFGKY